MLHLFTPHCCSAGDAIPSQSFVCTVRNGSNYSCQAEDRESLGKKLSRSSILNSCQTEPSELCILCDKLASLMLILFL